jgi:hypothetical protein
VTGIKFHPATMGCDEISLTDKTLFRIVVPFIKQVLIND